MPHNQDIQLATALRGLITLLVKKLRKESATGSKLSLTERSTMSLLYQHKKLMPTELASMEKITNQSMSQILNHLSELGYINRRISKEDKRKSLISLSAKGAAVLKQVRSERDSWLYQALSKSCSAEELDVLKKALGPLKKLVEFEEI